MARTTLREWCKVHNAQDLLRQWDYEKNAPHTPDSISYGSSTIKLWWICDAGHHFQMSAYQRKAGRRCPYCTGKIVLPGINDLATISPELLEEWDPEKNGTLQPNEVLSGTHRKVWWRCKKGHQWQAEVRSRVYGTGCPICTGKKVVKGINDLTVTNPELIPEWSEKNRFTPDTVSAGSERKVWWKCKKGHEWKAAIFSRVRGVGCPVCTNRVIIPGENDLATLYPALAAQWDREKNGALSPEQCSSFSTRKVWWRCAREHSWQASVSSRAIGRGCPYCSGRLVLAGFNDLATTEPAIAAQWADDLNGDFTPEMVTKGSGKKVWWRCNYGHVWNAVIFSRTGARRSGCPICAGQIGKKRLARMQAEEKDILARLK